MSKAAVIIGSLRRGSFSRMIARGAIELAPEGLDLPIVEIGDLPLYDEDLDKEPPEAWQRFREAIAPAEGILFVTPEYNRSIPGCLKNAIDVGSRPAGRNGWAGKRAAVISVTPSRLGAFGANHALRQCFVFLDMPAMQQPEAYIANAKDLVDAQGRLADPSSRDFLRRFMAAFHSWIRECHAPGK